MDENTHPDFIVVMNSLASHIDEENNEHFKDFIQNEESLSNITNVSQFNSEVTNKFNNFTRAYVKLEVSKDNSNLVFLYSNYNFVYNQFLTLFEKMEGSACSVDKTTTVLNAIERHLITGDNIQFDYSLKVTYFLPKRIFVNHESIMEFYSSLIHLYYGNNVKYLLSIKNIYDGL